MIAQDIIFQTFIDTFFRRTVLSWQLARSPIESLFLRRTVLLWQLPRSYIEPLFHRESLHDANDKSIKYYTVVSIYIYVYHIYIMKSYLSFKPHINTDVYVYLNVYIIYIYIYVYTYIYCRTHAILVAQCLHFDIVFLIRTCMRLLQRNCFYSFNFPMHQLY